MALDLFNTYKNIHASDFLIILAQTSKIKKITISNDLTGLSRILIRFYHPT